MLSSFWNWIKSLFYSCFPSLQPDEPWREVEPLLIADNQNIENNAQQNASSSQLIVRELLKPATLTAEESALTIYHAQRGENDYIDNLSVEKQNTAYKLIKSFVNYNINQINHWIRKLEEVNVNANRLSASWRRVRSDFMSGDYSQYSISPICNEFAVKNISDHDKHSTLQKAFIHHIVKCFELCKLMLKLNISKRKLVEDQRCRTPTKEDMQDEIMRTETRANAKTLKLLNDFNRRSEENNRENPQLERRARRGKLYGYN